MTKPQAQNTGTGNVDEKVLATIRALIAKAESTPFEAEADAFMKKAMQFLTRYHLDLADVQAGVGPEKMGHQVHSFRGEMYGAKMWKRMLFWGVPKLFSCRAYTTGAWSGTMVGPTLDVILAYDLYNSLRNRLVEAAKKDLAAQKYRGLEIARGKELNYITTFCEHGAKAVVARIRILVEAQERTGIPASYSLEHGDQAAVTPAQINALMVVNAGEIVDYAQRTLGVNLKKMSSYSRPWTPQHDAGAAARGTETGNRLSLRNNTLTGGGSSSGSNGGGQK